MYSVNVAMHVHWPSGCYGITECIKDILEYYLLGCWDTLETGLIDLYYMVYIHVIDRHWLGCFYAI